MMGCVEGMNSWYISKEMRERGRTKRERERKKRGAGGPHTALRKLNQIKLLAFFRPSDMRRQEGIHERLEIRPPPLRQRIPNLPFVIDPFAGELAPDGGEAFVQAEFEAFDFVVFGLEVVAWSNHPKLIYVFFFSQKYNISLSPTPQTSKIER